MKYTKEISDRLNDLLEKNYDAEAGYKAAKNHIKNSNLKDFFNERSKDRYDFGHELKEEIRLFSETPDKGTSLKGDVHRVWMDLKSKFSENSDEALLEEAVRGEEKALAEYNEILEEMTLAPSTENMLKKQRDSVKAALKSVKTFEELI
ncbi:ferritin-like domain-containing protein [Psychroflexus tropicus]|uniref:ferritin-like domain-containing protein n=1 Tax=Psychroflexus tropicus TaxID=197345 RepID=UPI000379D956|nr:PA2169 family four-helix-bundle protein [Psychroflexus tropicus]